MASSKKTTAKKSKTKAQLSDAPRFSLMTSMFDIVELSKIKLEPQENWRLVSKKHKLNEAFTTGLLGKDGFLLMKTISEIYVKKADELPPVKLVGKDKKEYLLPFWGKADQLESISVDEDNKVIELNFTS